MIIIPICLIDCSSIIILSILREGDYSFFELDYRVLLIMITAIYSTFILQSKYYLHHILAYILVLIGIIGYSIVEYTQIDLSKESKNRIILFFGLMVLLQFLTGFQECYEKYLMNIKFISPYMIVSLEGIAGLIIISLSFIPLSIIECPIVEGEPQLLHCNRYSKEKAIEDIGNTFLFIWNHLEVFIGPLILLYLSFMLFNIFRVLTNQHCSPIHRGFADIVGYFLYYVIGFIVPSIGDSKIETGMHKYPYFLAGGICFLIIIIGTFVFLEITIIKWNKIFYLVKNIVIFQ